MQSLHLQKSNLTRKVYVPSSKSYANRALVMASLIGPGLTLRNLPEATDVTYLFDCLSSIGLRIRQGAGELQFLNSFPSCESELEREVSVGEGGTTARFLASMLLLGNTRYTLLLGDRLKERPWQEFLTLAAELGGNATLEGNKLTIQGPIKLPAKLEIDCSQTTQFASGFQLLSVTSKTQVVPVNMTSSQSYWAMTEKMVNEITSGPVYEIPLDWSSASYPLAFGALNQEIEFPGLHPDPFQADSKFFELLSQFECVRENELGLTVSPIAKAQNVELDVSDCLDLVPTLGYFLAHVPGKHKLRGIRNLVHKESDRLSEVIKLLALFQRRASTDGETLLIEGKEDRNGSPIKIEMPDDHRMVMAGTLFLLHHAGGSISPQEAVAKSYPRFFEIISAE